MMSITVKVLLFSTTLMKTGYWQRSRNKRVKSKGAMLREKVMGVKNTVQLPSLNSLQQPIKENLLNNMKIGILSSFQLALLVVREAVMKAGEHKALSLPRILAW